MKNTRRFPTIALIGNPNCGKTTVFNNLTGSDQRVGNWPGVTVEKAEGFYESGAGRIRVVDLPGVYGLTALAADERISRDYLMSREADLIVDVVDAAALERNLYLSSQLIELGLPFMVVLTMTDLAAKRGASVEVEHLARHLGVPVVPVVAIDPGDFSVLKLAIDRALADPPVSATRVDYQDEVERVIAGWTGRLEDPAARLRSSPRWLAVKLLENDAWIRQALESRGVFAAEELPAAAAEIRRVLKAGPDEVIAAGRYGFAHGVARDVISQTPPGRSLTDGIDRVVMHRVWGIPVFFVVMFLVFQLTSGAGGALIGPFEQAAGFVFVQGLESLLGMLGAPAWAITLLARGIGTGVQTVATFIPVIFIMFAALSVLEDSGYMARAAFMMDRLMRAIGLPGKAFVPLMVGFGCSVPAVLGTRSLDSRRDRLLTIFMVPFMSCGARLPVYAFFAAVFFPAAAGPVVFSLYLAGILLAVGSGFILKRLLFRGETSHFVMELPPYHTPRPLHILTHSWDRLRHFLIRAGKVIVLFVSVFGLLNSLGPDGSLGNDDTGHSVLAMLGKAATPVFAPMGIEQKNWPATVALFAGVFAKEAVIGTLNSLYSQNAGGHGNDPGEVVRTYFPRGPGQAYAFLLFVLIYFPCVSTLGAAIKEMGAGLGLLLAVYMTGLAWVAATLFYQLTTGGEPTLVALALGIGLTLLAGLRLVGDRLVQAIGD